MTSSRTALLGRTAVVLAATTAPLLGSGAVASADTGTEAADVNFTICPDVTGGLGLGNLLGLLGGGTANPGPTGGDVVCLIDDRDLPAEPDAGPDA